MSSDSRYSASASAYLPCVRSRKGDRVSLAVGMGGRHTSMTTHLRFQQPSKVIECCRNVNMRVWQRLFPKSQGLPVHGLRLVVVALRLWGMHEELIEVRKCICTRPAREHENTPLPPATPPNCSGPWQCLGDHSATPFCRLPVPLDTTALPRRTCPVGFGSRASASVWVIFRNGERPQWETHLRPQQLGKVVQRGGHRHVLVAEQLSSREQRLFNRLTCLPKATLCSECDGVSVSHTLVPPAHTNPPDLAAAALPKWPGLRPRWCRPYPVPPFPAGRRAPSRRTSRAAAS